MDVSVNEKSSMIYAQTMVWTTNGAKTTLTALKQTEATSVKTVPVTAVSLNLDLNVGSTASFEAMVSPTNASNKQVTWTSSNPSVATVDANGNVKAVKAGNATITATTKDGAKKASIGVTVK